jgi:phosphotransacetylase
MSTPTPRRTAGRDHRDGRRRNARFGLQPRAALLSHSNFGTSDHPSAVKMRRTLALLREQAPWLEVDGEMHGDVALDMRRAPASDAAQHADR